MVTQETTTPKIDDGERLLDITEVAERLGVCRATVYWMIQNDKLAAFRIGFGNTNRQITRVRRRDLEEFIERHTARPPKTEDNGPGRPN